MDFSYGSDNFFAQLPDGLGAPTHGDVATTASNLPEAEFSDAQVRELLAELAAQPAEIGAAVMQYITEHGITDPRKIAAYIAQTLAARKPKKVAAIAAPVVAPAAIATQQTVITSGRHYRGDAHAPAQYAGMHVPTRDAGQRFPWKELGDTLKYIGSLRQGFTPQVGLPGKTRTLGAALGA